MGQSSENHDQQGRLEGGPADAPSEERSRGRWESEGGALVEGPHMEERVDDEPPASQE